MAFVTIDDRSARTEVSFFSKAFDANKDALNVDDILIIRGRASHDDYSGGIKISADYAFPMAQAVELFAEALQITVDEQSNVDEVITLLKNNRFVAGDTATEGNPVNVYFHINGEQTEGKIRLSANERTNMTTVFYQQLLESLGKSRVALKYNLSRWQEPKKAAEDEKA